VQEPLGSLSSGVFIIKITVLEPRSEIWQTVERAGRRTRVSTLRLDFGYRGDKGRVWRGVPTLERSTILQGMPFWPEGAGGRGPIFWIPWARPLVCRKCPSGDTELNQVWEDLSSVGSGASSYATRKGGRGPGKSRNLKGRLFRLTGCF
jgi:hypothetical protein